MRFFSRWTEDTSAKIKNMKNKTSPRFLPSRGEVGQYVAKTNYGKIVLPFFVLLGIVAGILYSVLFAPTKDIAEAATVDIFRADCQFIEGGYACDDPEQIIDALSDYEDICGLDSVLCEHEKKKIVRLQVSAYTSERDDVATTATVTAYSKLETCPDNECVVASGKRAVVGMVACPRRYPFGTKVLIEGVEYSCEDRTALRFDGRFDIFMGDDDKSYIKALKYGKQQKQIVIKS